MPMSRQLFNIYELRPMLSSFAIHYHHLFVVILALACAASAANNEVDTLISWLHSSPSSSPSSVIYDNSLSGNLPAELGRISNLEVIRAGGNKNIEGKIPDELGDCNNLQVLGLADTKISGSIPVSLGNLSNLQTLSVCTTMLSGEIPPHLGNCSELVNLFLYENDLSGSLPPQLGKLQKLEKMLLWLNNFHGTIPREIGNCKSSIVIDLSLNFFRQLSETEMAGNQGLCSKGRDSCFLRKATSMSMSNNSKLKRSHRLKLVIALLITLTIAMAIFGAIAVFRARKLMRDDCESEMGGDSWPWHFTPFQKLNFSVEQVLKCLVEANVIGKGCSGIVYRAELENGEVIAVKKLWPTTMAAEKDSQNDRLDIRGVRDSFSTEVKTLGSIRHKNIVRFLGCCWNRNTRLLMYNYMPNGSLGSLLHERSGGCLEWEVRYRIILEAAQGLAYLHHAYREEEDREEEEEEGDRKREEEEEEEGEEEGERMGILVFLTKINGDLTENLTGGTNVIVFKNHSD